MRRGGGVKGVKLIADSHNQLKARGLKTNNADLHPGRPTVASTDSTPALLFSALRLSAPLGRDVTFVHQMFRVQPAIIQHTDTGQTRKSKAHFHLTLFLRAILPIPWYSDPRSRLAVEARQTISHPKLELVH